MSPRRALNFLTEQTMTQGIEGITTAALALALDAASLRQQAIAANIANAGTDGYQPVAVDFESQLDAARRELADGRTLSAESLAGVAPRLVADPAVSATGLPAQVSLDLEMAKLAQNGVQYQALAAALGKQFSLMALAVNDGKK
jgi:flagellar basal-body rod protein FlgB